MAMVSVFRHCAILVFLFTALVGCDPRAEEIIVIELNDSHDACEAVQWELGSTLKDLGFTKMKNNPSEYLSAEKYTKEVEREGGRATTIGVAMDYDSGRRMIRVHLMQAICRSLSPEARSAVEALEKRLNNSGKVKSIRVE
jgi:hypothetical protein